MVSYLAVQLNTFSVDIFTLHVHVSKQSLHHHLTGESDDEEG